MSAEVELTAVLGPNRVQRAEVVARCAAACAGSRVIHIGPDRSIPEALRDVEVGIDRSTGEAVIDVPLDLPIEILLARLANLRPGPNRVHLRGVVVVVDLEGLAAMLRSAATLELRGLRFSDENGRAAVALLVVHQIEHATAVVLRTAAGTDLERLRSCVGLLHAMNPTATITCDSGGASWALMHALDEIAGSWSQPPTIHRAEYRRAMPFHPVRLKRVLDTVFDTEDGVVRSIGTATFATRSSVPVLWDQIGGTVNLHGVNSHPSRPPLIGQDLVIVTSMVNTTAVVAALDGALLTDEEFLLDPMLWKAIPDPFGLDRIMR